MAADLVASSQNEPEAFQESLDRLANKASVRVTIVLDRASGAILKTIGNLASMANDRTRANPSPGTITTSVNNNTASTEVTGTTKGDEGEDCVRELAGLAWSFVNTAEGLVTQLDEDDECKLLRLRTKQKELVIVPHPKYLLVVMHDTPLA